MKVGYFDNQLEVGFMTAGVTQTSVPLTLQRGEKIESAPTKRPQEWATTVPRKEFGISDT